MEEKFEIKKETVLKYNMKEEFPEVFKVSLEVGKWYKNSFTAIFKCCELNYKNKPLGYGFTHSGVFVEEGYNKEESWNIESIEIATKSEVREALIKEAIKRGFQDGVYITRPFEEDLGDCKIDYWGFPFDNVWLYEEEDEYLEHHGYVIYSRGQWAEIIATKTREQAEKELNCKIID